MNKISVNELVNLMGERKDLILIESLPTNYFLSGHLPGAINIDVSDAEQLLPKLSINKDQPIVTYCASRTCKNSHTVYEILVQKGFKNVACYEGGKEDWLANSLTLVK